jgi:hypothetical protein
MLLVVVPQSVIMAASHLGTWQVLKPLLLDVCIACGGWQQCWHAAQHCDA